ncbi:MAG: hypothetical protein U1G07_04230 [Verrucomicrobiota bacterium]
MNPSALVLLGAFDALIALIQSERDAFCKSFDPEAAIQTLKKVRAEFVSRLIAYTHAQAHAGETFRTSIDQLLASLPQGCDLEIVVRSLQHTVVNYLPQGPTPPTPSVSSSKSPF